MTQPGHSTAPLAQAWDDLIKWLSHAPPSQQAAALQNPQGALAQFGLGGVSPAQLNDVITHSPSFDRSYAINQGSGGNHHNTADPAPHPAIDPTPHPGESAAAAIGRVFNYHMENNYSQVVDNSVNVAGNVSGGIHQHNVVGDHNTTGPSFDIDGPMSGQIVTGDHSNAAGHDLDASITGAGATHVGSGASFGSGTNFGSGNNSGSGTNTFTDNHGARMDNHSYSDSSTGDHSTGDHSDHSYSDSSTGDHSDHSDHSADYSQHAHVDGNLDVHGDHNF